MSLRFFCAVVVGLFASEALAHGLERDYGTPSKGGNASRPVASSGGSPEFTLLALDAVSSAMELALDEGRTEDVRELGLRLPGMVRELERRSPDLGPDRRGPVQTATRALSESTARIDAKIRGGDIPALRVDLVELQEHIASMRSSLRAIPP